MKEKKQTVKVRRILAAVDGEVKYWRAEIGGVAWCFGDYYTVNKRYFKRW